MIVTIVHIWVKPENREAFIEATKETHRNSIQEPGNRRFDFLQDAEDLNKFTLYEAYVDAESVAAHNTTAHYLTWRETVQDWMAQNRQGVKHSVIAPKAASLW